MKSFKQYIIETPYLDIFTEPSLRLRRDFDSDYLEEMETAYQLSDGHKFLKHENLGEIHPGYELYRHSSSTTDDDGKIVHLHDYSIVHKNNGEVAGEIQSTAGKIDPNTGEHTRGTGKGLAIRWVGVHPDHSSKKAGTSLPIAAYKFLHKLGHSIKSDATHSRGGAILWNRLRKDPDVKDYVKLHDESNNSAVPAHKLSYGAIWKKNSSGAKTTLVLHAKPKKIISR